MASKYDIASQSSSGTLNGNSDDASISADGNILAFVSYDSSTGVDQVYAKNEQTAALTLVSQSSSSTAGNGNSIFPTISANGTMVGFESTSTNLAGGATGGNEEVYVKNLQTGGLTLVSQTSGGTAANNTSEYAALSSDGNTVAFDSNASNLGLGASGTVREVYVKNISSNTLNVASQTSTGTQANADSRSDSVSADGNTVVFDSTANNLGSSSGADEVYVKNMQSGALTIASQTSGGTIANGASSNGSVSADGSLVAFQSTATNLVAGATAGNSEVYLKSLQTGQISLISAAANGTIANGTSDTPILSADGRYAMFESTATNLVAGATSGTMQVYVKNLQTGALSLLSKDATGAPGNNASFTNSPAEQAFSADDTKTTFSTDATNLAGTAAGTEVVLRDTTTTPSDSLNPVAGDNIVNGSEVGSATFSGTTDPGNQFVTVSIDTPSNQIGTATVQSDGSWSLTANLGSLSQGSHTEIATAQGSSYLSSSSSQGFAVDTVAPTVGFDQGVTFANGHTATFNGTVSDPASTVTNVEVFDNGNDLGGATLNGDGTWTLANAHLDRGTQNLTAVATDAAGNMSSPTPPPFTLETGIRGQPYSSDEEDFDSSGNLTGETFTRRNGAVYKSDFVINEPNGDHLIDTNVGTYFDNKNFFAQTDLFSPDYSRFVETRYNRDGSYTTTAYGNDLSLESRHDDTMSSAGSHDIFVFKPHFGQDLITDFSVGGAGHDILSLSSSEFTSVAQVLAHTQEMNGSAVIHVDAHDTITVQNVTKAELKAHPNDFTFHA